MENLFIEDYIKKVIMLEKQVGHKTTYHLLKPFSINRSNLIISIQNAAKKIADFIGLQGLTFIVAIVKLEDKVGGHVELDYENKKVFIELSKETVKFDEAILATLSHEISHKYLHLNGISTGIDLVQEYENEILTDITAVFIGLGKLMLNGCECEIIRNESELVETKESLKVGYLNRYQLAFVYHLVCAMRGISANDMLSDLNEFARFSVRNLVYNNFEYFNPKYKDRLYKTQLENKLKEKIKRFQKELDIVDKHLRFLKENIIENTETFLEEKNKLVAHCKTNLTSFKNVNTYDPCLFFLYNLNLTKKVDKSINELKREISNSLEKQKELNKVTKLTLKSNLKRKKTFFGKIFGNALL